ncbi:hypothetical protein LY76DRAFT_411942 [Colletotrichum caudatum]|nr:hypothetical protein LY76DRAFT_411942 [Colletotrichum caudatum]
MGFVKAITRDNRRAIGIVAVAAPVLSFLCCVLLLSRSCAWANHRRANARPWNDPSTQVRTVYGPSVFAFIKAAWNCLCGVERQRPCEAIDRRLWPPSSAVGIVVWELSFLSANGADAILQSDGMRRRLVSRKPLLIVSHRIDTVPFFLQRTGFIQDAN